MSTTQIAVRLPDEIVAAIDVEVRRGHDRNRTELVRRAVNRELRRRTYAEMDAILAVAPKDPELEEWLQAASTQGETSGRLDLD